MVIEFVRTLFFLIPKAILYSCHSFFAGFFLSFWWSDTTSFSLQVLPSQSTSGAHGRRRLNAVPGQFYLRGGLFSVQVVTSRTRVMSWAPAAATRSSQLPVPHSGTINTAFHAHNEVPAAECKLQGFLLSADNHILAVVLISHDR